MDGLDGVVKFPRKVRCPRCGKQFKSAQGLTQDGEVRVYVPAHKRWVKDHETHQAIRP